jgi:hypothetical protein
LKEDIEQALSTKPTSSFYGQTHAIAGAGTLNASVNYRREELAHI